MQGDWLQRNWRVAKTGRLRGLKEIIRLVLDVSYCYIEKEVFLE